MGKSNKAGKTSVNAEVHVPKEIIARRIQEISSGINKGRKSHHYFVV
jgi:hypothetical protein